MNLSKAKYFIIPIMLVAGHSLAQSLITTPNALENGKRAGLWSEFRFTNEFQVDGSFNMLYNGNNPYTSLFEGFYINSRQQGLWKEYWIFGQADSATGRAKLVKGPLKSIWNYMDDTPTGSFFEFYKSGSLRLVGHFENFPMDRYDTIVAYREVNDDAVPYDTILHTTLGYRPTGEWRLYAEDGNLIRTEKLSGWPDFNDSHSFIFHTDDSLVAGTSHLFISPLLAIYGRLPELFLRWHGWRPRILQSEMPSSADQMPVAGGMH